jgi:hypothetical protein
MPELPDTSLAWEDPSSEDRRALTELVVDKILVAPHPHKIVDGKRHYTIRAIPYQDPEREAARLKGVHEARVKIVPRVCAASTAHGVTVEAARTLAAPRRIVPHPASHVISQPLASPGGGSGAGSSPRQQQMSGRGFPAGLALGRPSIVLKSQAEGRAVQLEDLLPTGRRSFDSGGEALIQLCATSRLGTVSPGVATAPPQVPPRYWGAP